MKDTKNHLKAITSHEEETGVFDIMISYLMNDNNLLIKQICEGEVFIPSFILLKELQQYYSALYHDDHEIDRIFDNLIECSKIFYYNLTENNNITNLNKYQHVFEKKIQPLGQQIIDLLVNLKYRIHLIDYYRDSLLSLKNKDNIIRRSFYNLNQVLYKITLMRLLYHKMTKKLYYLLICFLFVVFWLVDFNAFSKASIALYMFINIMLGVGLIILTVVSNPLGDFGTKDIDGKSIVAYKYKTFLNNQNNKKLLKVVAMQDK